jgi:Asp-tRNA(Asn)/Glu-tRNA(Gln) amidotransferase A subunit family amidase
VYARAAARAHALTNCLTEVCVGEAEAEAARAEEARRGAAGDNKKLLLQQQEPQRAGLVDLRGGLAGVPVSLKDTICVAGRDTSVGYSAWTGRPEECDGAMVRILKEAGEQQSCSMPSECVEVLTSRARGCAVCENKFTNHFALVRVCQ